MSERRRNYRYDRILISSERVLDPEFNDAVVFLSGAQIEMLRNVTSYLRRLDTYVTETHLGYYITPTTADYDDILAIVADLEETLMGNPNTIWGYADIYNEWEEELLVTAGKVTLTFSTVPEGEVWIIKNINAVNGVSGDVEIQAMVRKGVYDHMLVYEWVAGAWTRVLWHGEMILAEDDYLHVDIYNCKDDDNVFASVSGYKMAVPT